MGGGVSQQSFELPETGHPTWGVGVRGQRFSEAAEKFGGGNLPPIGPTVGAIPSFYLLLLGIPN